MKKTFVLALAAVLLISACGKQTLTPQIVTFELKSNPTTGYSWQASQSEELFQIESVYTDDEHAEGMVGVGGVETFTLTPLKAGTTELTLTYARSWESGEQTDQVVYVFEIDKELQVKMVDGYSIGVEEPIPAPTPKIR